MTKDQAFEAAEEEWESMNWRERVGKLEWGWTNDADLIEQWLNWMDQPITAYGAASKVIGNLKTNLSFEAFLNHLAHEEWIPARAEKLYTEAQADEADRVYDMKKEEGW